MLSRLAALFARNSSPDREGVPDGVRIYAVGDVHGQDDLLERMLEALERDAAKAPTGTECLLIMLGDYVDRGLGSRAVLDRLSRFTAPHLKLTCLKGNHEEALLDFLSDPRAGPAWVQHGGGETLGSYGVRPPEPGGDPQAWEAAREAFAAALPEPHLTFLRGLERYVVHPPYLFVHAGVDPAKPLAEQTDQDLFWIRDAFLNDERPYPYIVVHGHTPANTHHRDDRRIGIDTGAYISGVLTAVRLERSQASFLQINRHGR